MQEFRGRTLYKAAEVDIIEVIDCSASSLFRPRRFALPRAAGFFIDGRQEIA
jgi:hypothetical protein